jgi:hypothetical protein
VPSLENLVRKDVGAFVGAPLESILIWHPTRRVPPSARTEYPSGAAALFVTVKTVERNLSRVYAKLGVRSRAELVRRYGAGEQPV